MLHSLNQYGVPSISTGPVHQEDLQPNEGLRKRKHQVAPPLLREGNYHSSYRGRGRGRGTGWQRGFRGRARGSAMNFGSGSGSGDSGWRGSSRGGWRGNRMGAAASSSVDVNGHGHMVNQNQNQRRNTETSTSEDDLHLRPTQGDTATAVSRPGPRPGLFAFGLGQPTALSSGGPGPGPGTGNVNESEIEPGTSVASAFHQIRENALGVQVTHLPAVSVRPTSTPSIHPNRRGRKKEPIVHWSKLEAKAAQEMVTTRAGAKVEQEEDVLNSNQVIDLTTPSHSPSPPPPRVDKGKRKAVEEEDSPSVLPTPKRSQYTGSSSQTTPLATPRRSQLSQSQSSSSSHTPPQRSQLSSMHPPAFQPTPSPQVLPTPRRSQLSQSQSSSSLQSNTAPLPTPRRSQRSMDPPASQPMPSSQVLQTPRRSQLSSSSPQANTAPLPTPRRSQRSMDPPASQPTPSSQVLSTPRRSQRSMDPPASQPTPSPQVPLPTPKRSQLSQSQSSSSPQSNTIPLPTPRKSQRSMDPPATQPTTQSSSSPQAQGPLPTPKRSQYTPISPSNSQVPLPTPKRSQLSASQPTPSSSPQVPLPTPKRSQLSQPASKSTPLSSPQVPLPTPKRSQLNQPTPPPHSLPSRPTQETPLPPLKRRRMSGSGGSVDSLEGRALRSPFEPPNLSSGQGQKEALNSSPNQRKLQNGPKDIQTFFKTPTKSRSQPSQSQNSSPQSSSISQPPCSQSSSLSQPPSSQPSQMQLQSHPTQNILSQLPLPAHISHTIIADPQFQAHLASQLASQFVSSWGSGGQVGPAAAPSVPGPVGGQQGVGQGAGQVSAGPGAPQGESAQNAFTTFLYLAANGAFNAYLETLGMRPGPAPWTGAAGGGVPTLGSSQNQVTSIAGDGSTTARNGVGSTRMTIDSASVGSSSRASSVDVPLSQVRTNVKNGKRKRDTYYSVEEEDEEDVDVPASKDKGKGKGKSKESLFIQGSESELDSDQGSSREWGEDGEVDSGQDVVYVDGDEDEEEGGEWEERAPSSKVDEVYSLRKAIDGYCEKREEHNQALPAKQATNSQSQSQHVAQHASKPVPQAPKMHFNPTRVTRLSAGVKGRDINGDAVEGTSQSRRVGSHLTSSEQSSFSYPTSSFASMSTKKPLLSQQSAMAQSQNGRIGQVQVAYRGRGRGRPRGRAMGRGRGRGGMFAEERGVPIAVPTKKSLPPQAMVVPAAVGEEDEEDENSVEGKVMGNEFDDGEIIVGAIHDEVVEVEEEDIPRLELPMDVDPVPATPTPLPLPKRNTNRIKPEPISPPAPLPSQPRHRVKSEPSSTPEVVIKHEPELTPLRSRRIVTESCSLYPMRPNCLKSNPDWHACRVTYVKEELGKLRKKGIQKTKVFFRDDGLVIEWISENPVWSDTLEPAPVEARNNLADAIVAVHRSNAVSPPSPPSRTKRKRPSRVSDCSNDRNDQRVSTRAKRGRSTREVSSSVGPVDEPIEFALPLWQAVVGPREGEVVDSSEPEEVVFSVMAGGVEEREDVVKVEPLPIPKRSRTLARLGLGAVKVEETEVVVKSEDMDVSLIGGATSIPVETPQDNSPIPQDSSRVDSDDREAGEVVDVLRISTEEEDRIENEAREFLRRYVQLFDSDRSKLEGAYTSDASFSYSVNTPPPAPQTIPTSQTHTSPIVTGPAEIIKSLRFLKTYQFCHNGLPTDVQYDLVVIPGLKVLLTVYGQVMTSQRLLLVHQSFVLVRPPTTTSEAVPSGHVAPWPLLALSHQLIVREGPPPSIRKEQVASVEEFIEEFSELLFGSSDC